MFGNNHIVKYRSSSIKKIQEPTLIMAATILVMLTWSCCVLAESADGLATYKGAWFSIQYPAEFEVRPSLKSRTSVNGYDSAFFRSPNGEVEFYVFSPQWNGSPEDIEINPLTEENAAQKEILKDGKRTRWATIRAKDKSYMRSYADTEDTTRNTRRITGIKYSDQQAYNAYQEAYMNFVKSLVQHGD